MIYNNLFHNNPGYLMIPGILPFMGVFTTVPLFSLFLLCDSDIDRLLYVDDLDFAMLAAVLSVQRPRDLLLG